MDPVDQQIEISVEEPVIEINDVKEEVVPLIVSEPATNSSSCDNSPQVANEEEQPPYLNHQSSIESEADQNEEVPSQVEEAEVRGECQQARQQEQQQQTQQPQPTARRRGRPAGSSKKVKVAPSQLTINEIMLEEDLMNRRRSSRIKSLEERKEEMAKNKSTDDESSRDRNEVEKNENESPSKSSDEKHRRKKEKKAKKKEKHKNSESKKYKKRKSDNSSNNELTESNQKGNSKLNNANDHSGKFSSNCFTPPQPPLQYQAQSMKWSNNTVSATKANMSGTDSADSSPKPEKVKSRWRRYSELESICSSDSTPPSNAPPFVQPLIPKETEPLPPFDEIDENICLFER